MIRWVDLQIFGRSIIFVQVMDYLLGLKQLIHKPNGVITFEKSLDEILKR